MIPEGRRGGCVRIHILYIGIVLSQVSRVPQLLSLVQVADLFDTQGAKFWGTQKSKNDSQALCVYVAALVLLSL